MYPESAFSWCNLLKPFSLLSVLVVFQFPQSLLPLASWQCIPDRRRRKRKTISGLSMFFAAAVVSLESTSKVFFSVSVKNDKKLPFRFKAFVEYNIAKVGCIILYNLWCCFYSWTWFIHIWSRLFLFKPCVFIPWSPLQTSFYTVLCRKK